jgi:hypothetical protein
MRPSRLHTTTLCVSSAINAARRLRSSRTLRLAAATCEAMSARIASRWAANWLTTAASAFSSAPPSLLNARCASAARSVCASSARRAALRTQRR